MKRAIFFLSLSIFCAGCISLESGPVPLASVNDAHDSPYAISIIEEVNDGSRLNVLASVRAKVPWDTAGSIVRLSSLRDGEVLSTSLLSLPAAVVEAERASVSTILQADAAVQFSLSVAAVGMTDYQLEILWGEEAKPYAKTLNPPSDQQPSTLKTSEQLRRVVYPKARTLGLQNIEVESTTQACEKGEKCGISFKLAADLVNGTSETVHYAVLGVGFVWIEKDQPLNLVDAPPDNEEKVEIEDITLEPGEHRPVSLTFERPAPVNTGGEFKPVVRIISFR